MRNTWKNSIGGLGDRVGQVKNKLASAEILLKSKQNELYLCILLILLILVIGRSSQISRDKQQSLYLFPSSQISQKQYHKDCYNCIQRI